MDEERKKSMEPWVLDVLKKIEVEVKEDLEWAHGVEIHPDSIYLACCIVLHHPNAFMPCAGGENVSICKEEVLLKGAVQLLEGACVKLSIDLERDEEGCFLGLDEFSTFRSFIDSAEIIKEKTPSMGVWSKWVTREYADIQSKWSGFEFRLGTVDMLGKGDKILSRICQLLAFYLEEAQTVDNASPFSMDLENLGAYLAGLNLSTDKDLRHIVSVSHRLIAKLGAQFGQLMLLIDENFKQTTAVKPCLVAETASRIIAVPASWLLQLLEGDGLQKELCKLLIGYEHVVLAVTTALSKARPLKSRPIGSFLFLSASGHGPSEISKALAWKLFDSKDLVREFDMSEYTGTDSVVRLIGFHDRSSGFEGQFKDGALTEFIKNRPFSVVKLDNIELAHESVTDMLIEILSKGVLKDDFGNAFDFTKTVIIMTSRVLDVQSEKWKCVCPFTASRFPLKNELDQMMDHECQYMPLLGEAKRHFRIALLEKLDDVVVFNKFYSGHLHAAARLQLRDFAFALGGDLLILYPSEAALRICLGSKTDFRATATGLEFGGTKIVSWLEENVLPKLPLLKETNNVIVVYIDSLVGIPQLSFRVETRNGMAEELEHKVFPFSLRDAKSMIWKKVQRFRKFYALRKNYFQLVDVLGVGGDMESVKVSMQKMVHILDYMIASPADFCQTPFMKVASTYYPRYRGFHRHMDPRMLACGKPGMFNRSLGKNFVFDCLMESILRPCPTYFQTHHTHFSLLLLGLTASGKSDLLEAITERFSGYTGRKAFVCINSSECADRNMLFDLIYAESRQLQSGKEDVVRDSPIVVLVDQVEKANSSVFSALISVLDCGILKASEGRLIDFNSGFMFFTSDLGCNDIIAEICGHGYRECKCDKLSNELVSSAHRCTGRGGPINQGVLFFRFELLNRLDGITFFNPYAKEQMESFAQLPTRTLREGKVHFSDCVRVLFHADCEKLVQMAPSNIISTISYITSRLSTGFDNVGTLWQFSKRMSKRSRESAMDTTDF